MAEIDSRLTGRTGVCSARLLSPGPCGPRPHHPASRPRAAVWGPGHLHRRLPRAPERLAATRWQWVWLGIIFGCLQICLLQQGCPATKCPGSPSSRIRRGRNRWSRRRYRRPCHRRHIRCRHRGRRPSHSQNPRRRRRNPGRSRSRCRRRNRSRSPYRGPSRTRNHCRRRLHMTLRCPGAHLARALRRRADPSRPCCGPGRPRLACKWARRMALVQPGSPGSVVSCWQGGRGRGGGLAAGALPQRSREARDRVPELGDCARGSGSPPCAPTGCRAGDSAPGGRAHGCERSHHGRVSWLSPVTVPAGICLRRPAGHGLAAAGLTAMCR